MLASRPGVAGAQPELSGRLRLQGGYSHVSNQGTVEAPDDAWLGITPEVSLFVPARRAQAHFTYSLAASSHSSFGTDIANRLAAVSSFELSKRSFLLLSSEASETSVSTALATPAATGPSVATVPPSDSKLLTARLATAVSYDVSPSMRLGAALDGAFVRILNVTPVENYLANASFYAEHVGKSDIVGGDLRAGYASTQQRPPAPDQQIVALSLAPHWRHDISETLNSSIRAGVAVIVSPDRYTQAIAAPSAQGSLLYGRDAASFELSASIGPQANAVTAQLLNAEQVAGRLVVPLSLRYHVLAGVSAGFLHGQILNLRYDVPTPAPFDAILASLDVGWAPSEVVQIYGRYQLLDQITAAPSATATSTDAALPNASPAALRNIVTFGVQLSVPSRPIRIPTHFPQRVDGTDAPPPP